MLLRRILVALGLQRLEGVDESRAGVARIDDVVEKATAGGHVWVRELLTVFVDLRFRCAIGVGTVGNLLTKEDLDSALWPHDRNLRRRPSDVVVPANVL